ncbi:MAG: type III pantothenate kinase [Oscillospiraceae bacterium]|nr:type III pantothenate kinase [Oscillospiraceae bacterium]MBR7009787.1 type III pantothenate kinase [Oscillospiraceae bacterium]
MILAIDIGNSNIVLGCIENGTILFEARLATDRIKTSDQYCAELKTMLELFHVDPQAVEGSIVASVVPLVQQVIVLAVERLTGRPCLTVGPGLKTGLNIKIDNPAQAGSDLIVGAVAGIERYGAPLCIIDLGTATTICVVDQEGAFRGGAIAPGVMLSLNALSSGTAQLPGISLEKPRRAIGTNTVDSMRSGLLLGSAAMLDGMVERMEEELGCPLKVVATGGLAKFIAPLCKREMTVDENLLLTGLELLYRKNTQR